MKKTRLTTIIVILMLVLLLSSCSDSAKARAGEERPVAVAVLISNTSCQAAPNLTSESVKEAVLKAVSTYGYICVVNADGDPQVVFEGSCDIDPTLKEGSASLLSREASERTFHLLYEMQGVVADSPEVDILLAMRLAVRSLSVVSPDSEKIIVVISSGLSTTGLCDFTNNLLNGDPEIIAAALAEQQAIPDLRNTTVLWQQMGDVEAPQQALSPRQVNQLQETWRAIIEKGGGSLVISETPPAVERDDIKFPPVTTVALPSEMPISFEASSLTGEGAFEEPQFLTEDQVRFEPDSDRFMDDAAVADTLSPIADYMAAFPTTELVLVGATAGDDNTPFSMDLSQRRAERVRQVLIELGVPGERLVAVGLGSSDPWHIYGLGLGDLATQNRKTVLIDARSEIAQQILTGKNSAR